MLDWISYDWARAIHIIFVIAWMAALLMMPRLYIYQMSSAAGQPLFDTMSSATERLRKIIMTPAMILTWVFGLVMLAKNWDGLIIQPWIHIKLTAVVLMTGMHGWLVALGKKVRAGDAGVSEKALRLLNELPFVLAIIAVIAVVVQPFA
jgi:protoporphyrinogen IX oxidase